jgi:hypothetical protein
MLESKFIFRNTRHIADSSLGQLSGLQLIVVVVSAKRFGFVFNGINNLPQQHLPRCPSDGFNELVRPKPGRPAPSQWPFGNLFLTVTLIGLGLQIDERSLRNCPQAG